MWHDGLTFKLIKLNAPKYLINIIQEFLSNRVFRVKVNTFITIEIEIKCGCPQGAVLSPTLFTVYINDIPITKIKKSKTLLFADDVMFRSTYKKLTEKIITEWNDYIHELEIWSNQWKLNFAPAKCNFTIFSKTLIKRDIELLNLQIYGNNIIYEPNPRFLGITFDKNLNFDAHIEEIKKTCIGRLNILKVMSYNNWGLTPETLMGVYKSLIRSIIEYVSFAHNCMSKKSKKFLQKLQNNSIRICYKIKFNELTQKMVSTQEIHKIANIEMIEKRCETLKKEYIENAVATSNPIICGLINEYRNYSGGRTITHTTPLCSINVYDIKLPKINDKIS